MNFVAAARNVSSVNDPAATVFEQMLVIRCQAGDEAALGELIARYSPGLRLYLAKMTRDAGSADDLLQETWFDVYRGVNRLRQPGAFATWIYRIARDKVYRDLRRRRVPIVTADEHLADVVDGREDSFSREEAEAVRAALDALPHDWRDVLLLRFVEDLSYEQIAEVVGRPVGTVRSRLHYARSALRDKLKPKPSIRSDTHERK